MKRFTITEFREMYPTDDACLDRIFQLRATIPTYLLLRVSGYSCPILG